jgi:hypothetical protein
MTPFWGVAVRGEDARAAERGWFLSHLVRVWATSNRLACVYPSLWGGTFGCGVDLFGHGQSSSSQLGAQGDAAETEEFAGPRLVANALLQGAGDE